MLIASVSVLVTDWHRRRRQWGHCVVSIWSVSWCT